MYASAPLTFGYALHARRPRAGKWAFVCLLAGLELLWTACHLILDVYDLIAPAGTV
jgi:hypothetical protein